MRWIYGGVSKTVESEAEQWDFFRIMFESRACEGRPGFAFSNPVFIGE